MKAIKYLPALLGLAGPATAAVVTIGPMDDLQAAINGLEPGDTLELTAGIYILSARLGIQLACSAQNPCTVRPRAGDDVHIHRPNANQNIVDIESSQHVKFIGLEFSGGSRGLRIRESSFISIEDSHIHDTGDAAITANDGGSSYQGLRLIGNHIHHTNDTGEGMYLGCNNNACQMYESLIANNYIHHTNGPSVTQGDGIEVKEGSWGNIIRDNVIHDTGYPCILTYSTVGNGGPNLIEGNLMWGCGDHGIQVAADANIHNNIILGAAANGIANQPHQAGTPSNLVITHNTVLAPANAAYRASGISGSVVIANNALYAQSGAGLQVSGDLSAVTVTSNAGQGALIGVAQGFDDSGSMASDFVAASYAGMVPIDVFPAPGSILVGAANPAWAYSDDFNHAARQGNIDIGAYQYQSGGNLGWELDADFKPTGLVFADGFEL